MKDIYTVTFCEWESYGSIFQSMGLKHILASLGFRESILKCERAAKPSLIEAFKKIHSVHSFLRAIYDVLILGKLRRRYDKTIQFIDTHVKIIDYKDYNDMKQFAPEAKAYIAGSDQIWNPTNIKPWFFLDFVKKENKKIAYAASMGITEIQDDIASVFKEYLCEFDCVSVREEDNVLPISELYPGKVERHIDPVFLMEQEKWSELAKPYKSMKKPYILVFALFWDRKLNKKLKELHKRSGYDIVSVSSGLQSAYANKHIYDADPGEFLWLIQNAEAVISSSFHGLALSILFQKKFSAVINPNAPSRISCLLELLGIEPLEIDDLTEDKAIDYFKAEEVIKKERFRSKEYLKEALSGI